MDFVGNEQQFSVQGKLNTNKTIFDYMSPVSKKRNVEDERAVITPNVQDRIVPSIDGFTKFVHMKNEFASILIELYSDHNLLVQKSQGSINDSMYDSVAFGINEFLQGFPTFEVQQLRNITADYISANFEMDHYKQYIGISNDIRLKYCDEVRANKWGSMEVDLNALATAIKCNISVYIATPDSYFKENFIGCISQKSVLIAYVPAANRFFRLQKMAF